ncbi:DUF2254 domain-containing protein [bacterium]|nr:DUF2254 domain-containing protein [bacterium]
MKILLQNYWEALRSSFWFIPSLMLAGGIVLALVMLNLDRMLEADWFKAIGWVSLRGPEGARALLSSVASSMMTIASLTFSMTIITLQLASTQFGPRLLRNFIRDRGNQMVLGMFITTFAYCLMVLRAVNGTKDHQFVPELAITTGIALAMLSLGVLIYFIHHIASSIQAGSVIAKVGDELHYAMHRLYPEELGDDADTVGPNADMPIADFSQPPHVISASQSNYLQSVDSDRLFELAKEQKFVLKILYRPGHFIIKNAALVHAWPTERLNDEVIESIQDAFHYGNIRTLTQDIEFGIHQLVEVAVRALSPGINDPFTAASCIDRLSAAIAELSTKKFPSSLRYDEEGHLRIVVNVLSPSDIIDKAFHQIRQASYKIPATTLHLLGTFERLLEHRLPRAFHDAILNHAGLVYEGSKKGLAYVWDREEAKTYYRRVIDIYDNARV